MKAPQLRIPSLSSLFLGPRAAASTSSAQQTRWLHKTRSQPPVPSPIPIAPDVSTLLKLLGRNLGQYANQIPSWEALFTLTSPQLKELGVQPPRTRRYLLTWLDRYRRGAFGPGGDFKYVENGEAILKVASTESQDLKWVVNVPDAAQNTRGVFQEDQALSRVKEYSVRGLSTISGPYALPMQDGVGAKVSVVEGMWEHKQGYKVDGGERRRTEVRYKRKIAQRRAEREAKGGR